MGPLQSKCYQWGPQSVALRMLCPVTCGCTVPSMGQPWHTTGCPPLCKIDYVVNVSHANCEDGSPEHLRNSPGWMNLWKGVMDYYPSWSGNISASISNLGQGSEMFAQSSEWHNRSLEDAANVLGCGIV